MIWNNRTMFYICVFICLWTNDDKFHLPVWVILEVIYNWGFMNNSSNLNIMILMFHVLYHLPCFEFPCTYTLLLLLSDYLDVEYIISGFYMYTQCSVCDKRILSHSPILKCDICPNVYHISCLPSVSKSDSIYAERNNKSWMCISCAESTFPFNHYKEEYEFYDAVSHLWHSFPKEFSFELLQDQIFNPIEIDEFTSVLTYNADPDIHFFNDPLQGNLFKNY